MKGRKQQRKEAPVILKTEKKRTKNMKNGKSWTELDRKHGERTLK